MKKNVTIQLDPELIEYIENLAQIIGKKRTRYIVEVLKLHAKNKGYVENEKKIEL